MEIKAPRGSAVQSNATVNPLKVEIPYDKVFDNKQNIVFSAMYTQKVPKEAYVYSSGYSEKDLFLSGQVTMSARYASSDIE